mgnify:CR=1 FL=1
MASGLQNLNSVFSDQVNEIVEKQGVNFINDIHATGFTINTTGTDFLGIEGSTYINPGDLGDDDRIVDAIPNNEAVGFVKGLQAGDDTLFVGAGGNNYSNPGINAGIFYVDDYENGPTTNGINFTKNRQEKDPTEYIGVAGENFNHPDPDEQSQIESNQWLDIFDHKFTPNRKHLDPSEFKGTTETSYTNPGEFVGLHYYEVYDDAGLGSDFINNIHATGFTKLRQHKSPSEFLMVDGDNINVSNDNVENGTLFRQFGNSVFTFGGEQKNKYLPVPGNAFIEKDRIDEDNVALIQQGGIRSNFIQGVEVKNISLEDVYNEHINDLIDFENVKGKTDGRLDMRYNNGRASTGTGFLPLAFSRGDEPYVIRPIGEPKDIVTQHQDDLERVGKYLISPDGIKFIAAANAVGYLAYAFNRSVKHGTTDTYNELTQGLQRFQYTYNPLSAFSSAIPFIKVRVNRSFIFDEDKYTEPTESIFGIDLTPNKPAKVDGIVKQSVDDSKQQTTLGGSIVKNVNASIDGNTINNQGILGDVQTTAPITDSVNLVKKKKGAKQLDSIEDGYPFYFKDMRNNRILMFRGYIKGLSENISPTYSSENYVGRSEPVVTYQSTNRNVNFSLDLYANNFNELQYIYQKLDYLTSLAYPQYFDDAVGSDFSLIRPKPPLCRMRLADLYGGGKTAQVDNPELKHGILGYINSLSYTFNDEGTWNNNDEENRVPKFVTANIEFAVIHDQTPNINTRFYGSQYNKQTLNNQLSKMDLTYGDDYSDSEIPTSQPTN